MRRLVVASVLVLVISLVVAAQRRASASAIDLHLSKRTSCFDCEAQFAGDSKWMGEPSSCFDCERELVHATGSAFFASRAVAP